MKAVVEDTREIATEARHAVRQLELRRDGPDELALLERSAKSAILRATWRHPRRRRVVLKRCQPGPAEIEATVYAEILPRIPVRAPRLFGVWLDGDATWLAFEDMGDESPRLDDDRERAMVSRWLGELHRASRDLIGAPSLPDRSARHYLGLLESARERLVDRRADASDGNDERRLEKAIGLCSSLRSRWDAIADQAALLSPAFVHADVAPENLRIVRSAGRLEVTAIDWEKAGTGTPFADLAKADHREYASAAEAPLDAVIASAWVARLLRTLSHDWASKPISKLGRWRRRLERDMATMP